MPDDTTKVMTLVKLSGALLAVDSKEAINTANRVFALSRKLGFPKGELNAFMHKGMAYYGLEDDGQALKYLSDAVILAQKLNIKKPQAMLYEYLGHIYKRQSEFKKAEKASWQSHQIGIELKDSFMIIKAYFLLGNAKYVAQEYDSALYYLNLCEKFYAKKDAPQMRRFVYNDIAATHEKLGNIKEMLANFEKALTFIDDRKSYDASFIICNIIGANLANGNLAAAEKYMAEIDTVALGYKSYTLNAMVYGLKSGIAETKGDFKTALEYSKLARIQSDSSFTEARKTDIARVQESYEIKQAEENNRQLKLKQEEELADKNKVIFIVAAILVLVFLSGLWLFRTYKMLGKAHEILTVKNTEINQQKEEIIMIADNLKEANLSVETQKNIIERKNKDILSSINYASRIQNALLPPNRLFKDTFTDFVLYYKPRDIVSGDFYWLKTTTHPETNEPVIYVGVADCTGHGVPGAFMTVIGHELIEQVFTNITWIEPLAVLEQLNEKMGKTLDADSNMKDGMDIAFCRILPQRKRLDFAGAHRPLLYVRHGELNIVRGAKASIGGHAHIKLSDFEQHTLQMQENDIFYMYSDGITDQFGGPRNRKFGSRRLYELILKHHAGSLKEAKAELEENLERWMKEGRENQIDDMLFFGFRF